MRRGPKVQIPARETVSDGVQLGRVGVIAVIGFAIGIVWPRLAGVSLVPSAPVEGARQQALAAQDEASAEEQQAPVEEEESEPEPLSPAERLVIDDFKVTSCRDADGKTQKDCELDAEALLKKPLLLLATCPAAENAIGKLSVGVDLDFKAKRVSDPKSGRTTDLPNAVTRDLLACARRGFDSVAWGSVEPKQSSYTVYALVEFRHPQAVAEEPIVPASGSATVRWNVALIRKDSNSNAKIRARLNSGTRVIVTARQGEWYRVKYDAKGGEGWVHGAAIGMDAAP